MEPMTLLTIASTAMSTVGAIQQGQAASANAQAQQNAANYNAQVAENNARSVREQANAKEETIRRNTRIEQGRARAGMSQSGLGMTGSLLDVYDQSALFSEMDALNTRYDGEMQARGLMGQAAQERYAGSVAQMNGKAAVTSSYLNAGAAVLGGVSRYQQNQLLAKKG
jgi:hypothetical protein